MLISDLLSNNTKPNLTPFEKNINKILNEIKNFNPKNSHQNILAFLRDDISKSANFRAKNSEKNIQTLKNIFNELCNTEYYKIHPKKLENIQKEISNLFQKQDPKNFLKKELIDIKNELKNFYPQNSPKKIDKLIKTFSEKLFKIIDSNTDSSKNKENFLNYIKTDIKDILNKLEKINFYKNNPKILQITKTNLNNILKDKSYFISNNNKKIIQTLYQKTLMLSNIEKDTPHIQKLVENIKNILKNNTSWPNIQTELKNIENTFEKININFLNKQKTKNLLKSIQKDIKILLKSSRISPKHKEFNSLVKDTLAHFKTGKIKLLNQNQTIKNIGNITKNIDKIILILPKNEKYTPIKKELSNFSKDIKHIDFKQNIKNSGILYESKLLNSINRKNSFTQISKSDLKGILLSLKNDSSLKQHHDIQKNIENTLSQINAVQTNALIGENFTSYIPFAWNDLKDGYFSIAKLKTENSFSCKIELNLNRYGKVDILMLFHQEFLSMKMDIKDKEFENVLKKEFSSLQQTLKKLGFKNSIFFAEKQQNLHTYKNSFNNTLDMDIKV